MNNEKRLKILEVARYIIQNKATISKCAEHFNCSERTIQLYINSENGLISIDEELYNSVKQVQNSLESIGHYVGGKNGVREAKYKEYEADEIARVMIQNNLTVIEAAKRFNMPTSTLHDSLKRVTDEELKQKLEVLFESHKQTGKFHKN